MGLNDVKFCVRIPKAFIRRRYWVKGRPGEINADDVAVEMFADAAGGRVNALLLKQRVFTHSLDRIRPDVQSAG